MYRCTCTTPFISLCTCLTLNFYCSYPVYFRRSISLLRPLEQGYFLVVGILLIGFSLTPGVSRGLRKPYEKYTNNKKYNFVWQTNRQTDKAICITFLLWIMHINRKLVQSCLIHQQVVKEWTAWPYRPSPNATLACSSCTHLYFPFGWANEPNLIQFFICISSACFVISMYIYSCVEKNKHVCGGQAITTKT